MVRRILLTIFWVLNFITAYSQQSLIFKFFDNPDVPNGPVYSILPHGDTVFVGGAFHFWGPPIGPFGALDLKTGDVDTNFFRVVNFYGSDGLKKFIPDGKGGFYICGGYEFKVMLRDGLVKSFNGIMHVNSDGTIDLNFNPPTLSAFTDYENMILVDSILFAVGNFTKVGDSTRTYIVALDAKTGKVLPWKTDSIVVEYGGIKAIAVSDSVLYIGGKIQKVGDSTRYGIAALDLKTGKLLPWNPMVKYGTSAGLVYAIAINGNDIYIGGRFDSVGTYRRLSLALIDKVTGEIKEWNPSVTVYSPNSGEPGTVKLIKIHNSKLYIGGAFSYINSEERRDIACFDLSTGQLTSWKVNTRFRYEFTARGSIIYSTGGDINDLAFAGDTIFVAGSLLTCVLTGTDTIFRYGVIALDATNGNVKDWKGAVLFNDTDGPGVWSMAGATVYGLHIWNGKLLVAADLRTRIMGSLGRQVLQRNSLSAIDARTGKVIRDWVGPEFNFVMEINNQQGTSYIPVKFVSALAVMDSVLYVGGSIALVGGRWYNYADPLYYSPEIFVALDLKTGQIKKKWSLGSHFSYWGGYTGVKKIIPTPQSIYVAGGFWGLQGKGGLAVIDPRTGAILDWKAGLSAGVNSIGIKGDTLFVAGWFTKALDTIPRTFMAAFLTRLDSVKLLNWQTGPFQVGYDQYGRITTAVADIAIDDSVIYITGPFTITGDSARQKIASIYTYNGKVTGWKPDIPFLQYSFYNSVALTDSVVYLAGSGVEALSKRTGKRISQRWALGATPSSDVIEVNPKHRHVYIGGRFSTIYDGNNYYPIPFFIVRPYAEDIATTVEETPYVEIPRNYILHQNYPNPFNPTTRIEFEIPQKEHVKLTIYDILGREVMKLIDGEFNAGRYSVDVNMSGYPSGVYFYRLEAGKFTSVKKMMLIK